QVYLPREGIGSTQRELLEDVILERRSGDGSGCNNRQCNPNPLAIEEEKQLVVGNRAAHATPEVVYRRSRFMVTCSGIGEIVSCVERRSIPQLIQISMKLVRTGFRDVVDLRSSVPPLVDGIGERVDRNLRYRVQAKDEICRQSAVQIR